MLDEIKSGSSADPTLPRTKALADVPLRAPQARCAGLISGGDHHNRRLKAQTGLKLVAGQLGRVRDWLAAHGPAGFTPIESPDSPDSRVRLGWWRDSNGERT